MSRVSEQAAALGASALLVGPNEDADMWQYLGPDVPYDTVTTLVVLDEFVSLTKSYLDTNTEVILKADYSLQKQSVVDLYLILPMNPETDSVVGLTFF